MNWGEFFQMGGYAVEVWSCWSITLVVLIAFVIYPKVSNAKIRKEIKRQIAREQKMATRHPETNID
jgi:heme exporter protein D